MRVAKCAVVVFLWFFSIAVSQTFAADSTSPLSNLGNDSGLLSGIGDALGSSASSLLAGNPASLQTQAVEDAFATMMGDTLDRNDEAFREFGDISNLFGLSFTIGRFEANGIKTSYVTVPLSYTFPPKQDLGREWIVSAPLSVGEVNGAKTYSVRPGLALRVPVTSRWALTPALAVGYVKSNDLEQEAQQAGASLSSAYRIPLGAGGDSIHIGNLVGYYKTVKVNLAGSEFDPNIANTVFRNGVLYSLPLDFFNKLRSVEFSFVNTYFTGTKTYARSQNELAFSVGSTRRHMGQLSFLRLGVSVVKAGDVKGLRLNFGYYF
ncbi:hypothetical protein [Zhongshania sp.]|uniref:hypothetical protein n=1 Tax=Zhongshania sp. TaxID=1971902 RepID=UPI00262223CC|nr:hypothetical protein [Zhongshania sp.]